MWIKKKISTPVPVKDICDQHQDEVEIVISLNGLKVKWFRKILYRFVYAKVVAVHVKGKTPKTLLDTRLRIGDCAHISHKFEMRFD